MTKPTIALFGGTFDPIHLGHAEVARVAAHRLDAERVIFIPAKRSPLKELGPTAGDEDRMEMTALTIADDERFDVSDCELRRPAPSYTLDTVRHFRHAFGPATAIYWLLGADSVDELRRWHRIEELIDICHLATMYRGGYDAPAFEKYVPLWGRERVEKLRNDVIETPSIDISSTEIRRRLGAGEDISGMVHPDVAAYIHRHGLYART